MEIKNTISDEKAASIYENASFYAEGRRGIIKRYDRFAVKEERKETDAENVIANEATFTYLLSEKSYVPDFYYYDDEEKYLIREFIDGVSFKSVLEEKNEGKDIKKVILRLLDICRDLDKEGVDKGELQRPLKDVILVDQPYLIDFERCSHSRNPSNVTQFVQFIISDRHKDVFESINIPLVFDEGVRLCKKYKRTYEERWFQKIKERVEG